MNAFITNPYEEFKKGCRDKVQDPNVQWILASDVYDDPNTNIDVLDAVSNFTDSRVQGLIMMSEYKPTPYKLINGNYESINIMPSKYTSPKLISIT